MNLSELKEKLKSVNLHPIPVEDGASPDDAKGLTFSGSLDEFLDAVRALGVSAVFIATDELEEDSFIYEIGERSYNENDELDIESEEIDLCAVNPRLNMFKDRINQVGLFRLFSSASESGLNFYIHEDWWMKFIKLFVETVENVEHKKVEIKERTRIAQEEKGKELIKKVRELSKDASFRRLKTQRAMTNFASENIPDLETLEPRLLRAEIQKLYDKLNS